MKTNKLRKGFNMAEEYTREYLIEQTEIDEFNVIMFLCMQKRSKDFIREVIEGHDDWKEKVQTYIKNVFTYFYQNGVEYDPIYFGCTNLNLFENLQRYIDSVKLLDKDVKYMKNTIGQRYLSLIRRFGDKREDKSIYILNNFSKKIEKVGELHCF